MQAVMPLSGERAGPVSWLIVLMIWPSGPLLFVATFALAGPPAAGRWRRGWVVEDPASLVGGALVSRFWAWVRKGGFKQILRDRQLIKLLDHSDPRCSCWHLRLWPSTPGAQPQTWGWFDLRAGFAASPGAGCGPPGQPQSFPGFLPIPQ